MAKNYNRLLFIFWKQLDFRVIDLGMAQLVENDRVYTDVILGTTGYHSPEVLFDDDYDLSADIFVLGITFCVMVCIYIQLRTLYTIWVNYS